MKTELRIAQHKVIGDTNVVEVWTNGVLIGVVFGGDVPGIRLISKYPLDASVDGPDKVGLSVATVKITLPND